MASSHSLTHIAKTLCLVLCILAPASAAVVPSPATNLTNSGFVVTLTEKGLGEVMQISIDVLNKLFQDIKLPDINLDEHVPVIGHITLDFTNIVISNFKISKGVLAAKLPHDVTVSLSDLSFDLNMDYKWRRVHWPHASDHGSVSINPTSTNIALDVALGVSNGTLAASVVSDSATFGGFDIHFHGKVSWLYNILVDLLKSTIEKDVEKAVTAQITKLVDSSLNKAFQKLHKNMTLGGGKSKVDLDISVSDLEINDSFFAFGDDAHITDFNTQKSCPFPPVQIPPTTPSDDMLQIMVADSVINCVSWVSFTNGALNNTLTHAKDPKFPLNTTEYELFFPGLAILYPNHLMEINVAAADMPRVNTDESRGVTVGADLYLNFSVQQSPNSTETIHTHTLGMLLDFGLDLTAKQVGPNATIFAQVSELTINFTVIQTSIGPIDTPLLQKLASIVGPLVKDVINAALAKGFVLPVVDGLSLVNPVVQYHGGYFTVSTDFAYPGSLDILPVSQR